MQLSTASTPPIQQSSGRECSRILFYRLRVDRRTCSAGDDQRRAAEKEFIDAVLLAVLCEFLEIKDFAHAQAHGGDHDPVPRLVCFGGFVGAYFHAPSIGTNGGNLFFLTPVAVLELDTWRIAAGVTAPILLGEAAFHLSGADYDKVAAADRNILILGAFVEFIVRNALTVLHPFHAAEARDVQQHAAADHLVLGVLDAEYVEAARIDHLGLMAVVAFVLIEDVAERVPMRSALHAQHQSVVGIADLVPVLASRNGVGSRGQHLVDRVEAPAEQAGLRALAVERDTKRKYLAGADQACRLHDVLGRDMVEGADLVFLAPAAPVAELLAGLGDRLFADFDVHEACPSGFFVISRRFIVECRPLSLQYCAGRRCFIKRRSAIAALTEHAMLALDSRYNNRLKSIYSGRIFMKRNLFAIAAALVALTLP